MSGPPDPSARRVLALALPIILSNVTVPLVGIADTAVTGRMGSPAHLSAVAVGSILFGSIYWAFGFLRMGTGGIVAQAFGAGDAPAVRRAGWRAIVCALAIGALILLLQTPLLWLGLWAMRSEGWGPLAETYFRIRVLSAPATLATYALLGLLIGTQRMRAVLALQLTLNLVNVALNVALFVATDLGVAGIALATLASEWLAFGLGLWLLRDLLLPPPGARRPRFPPWLLERAPLARFFRVSRDLFIRTSCLTFAFYWLTVMGSRQGVAVLAANAVLLQMLHLMSYSLDGFAHAAETLTGFAIGRRDPDALGRAVRASIALALPFAAAFALAFALAGGTFIDLMTTESEVRALARAWLPWIALAPLVGVWSFLLDGIFVGATHTREMRDGMLISLALFVPASVLLTARFGNHGLWMAYHVLLIARAATLARRYPRVLDAARTTALPEGTR